MTLRRFLTSFCSFHKSQSYKPFFVRLHAVNIPDHVSRSFSLNASGIRFPVAIHISDMHVAQSPLARVFEFEYRGAWPVRISVACWLFVLDVKLDYPLSRQAMCKKVRVEILTNEGCGSNAGGVMHILQEYLGMTLISHWQGWAREGSIPQCLGGRMRMYESPGMKG